MTNTELLAKIKAEIDKRYAEYREKMKTDDFTYYEGMADALDLFEQFLDTLESEKQMNLEDAMKELDEKIALVKQRGTWDGVDVDKYMDEVRGREPEKPMNQDGLKEEVKRYLQEEHDRDTTVGDVARHFAQWGAEHLADARKTLEIKPGDEVTINGHKIVYDKDKGYVTIVKSEESVPNDLEEAARHSEILTYPMPEDGDIEKVFKVQEARVFHEIGFIAGAKWGTERFAKIVRANLTKIDKSVQSQFEQLYMDLTGNKMYGGYND